MKTEQALADVVTIGLLQERAVREADPMAEQIQTAPDSRALIELARGVVSATTDTGVDEVFRLMREHRRRNHRPLRDAAAVIDGAITPQQLRRSRPRCRARAGVVHLVLTKPGR